MELYWESRGTKQIVQQFRVYSPLRFCFDLANSQNSSIVQSLLPPPVATQNTKIFFLEGGTMQRGPPPLQKMCFVVEKRSKQFISELFFSTSPIPKIVQQFNSSEFTPPSSHPEYKYKNLFGRGYHAFFVPYIIFTNNFFFKWGGGSPP